MKVFKATSKHQPAAKTMEYKDQYGNEILPGDFITYPVRSGSSMWMTTAVVLGRSEQPISATVSVPALNVASSGNTYRGAATDPAKVTVTQLNRCTVVPRQMVPAAMREKLLAAR